MNRILLSLICVFIALAGIACVSASSDFNETVDQDIVIDINETAVPIDEIDIIVDEDEERPVAVDNSRENDSNGDVSPSDLFQENETSAINLTNLDVSPSDFFQNNKDDAMVFYSAKYIAFKKDKSIGQSLDAVSYTHLTLPTITAV